MADVKKPTTPNGVSAPERGTAETVEVIRGKPVISGHDALGGASAEELRRTFYRWENGKLEIARQRPAVRGVRYFEVLTRKGKLVLTLSEGSELSQGELERVTQQFVRKFNIRFDIVDYKPIRGFTTLGLAGSIAVISGILEAVQLLEFPEQIDAIKADKVDPIVVRRALERSRLRSLSQKGSNNLQLLSWEDAGNLIGTNLLIDTVNGNVFSVILEDTETFQTGDLVGIGRSRYVRDNVVMKSKMFKDNRTNDLYYQSEKGAWLVLGPSTGSWEVFPFE